MLDEGRSLSGHERTLCYLNLGNQTGSRQFANISASSGLDHADDGRAVAVADWDNDGDLDLWMSNRNAPRLRFLRNEYAGPAKYVQIGLRGGQGVNRDAIGARVEVRLSDGTLLIKTLRAGESFLSQSSKWIHFGLGGAEDKTVNVAVRWPDGERRDVGALEPNARYLIVRGGAVERIADRGAASPSLEPKTVAIPPPADTARIPVVYPHPAPSIRYRDLKTGQMVEQPSPAPAKHWLLVNFWATWCAPCLAELGELTARASALKAANIDVLALSVDGVATTGNGKPERVARILDKMGFPFAAGHAETTTIGVFQELDDVLTAAIRPLPVPCSFLIDPYGRVVFIYKGSASVDQLLLDAQKADLTLEDRWARAALLAGSTIDDVAIRKTRATLSATWHFRQADKFKEKAPPFAAYFLSQGLLQRPEVHKARAYLGSLLGLMGREREAREHLEHVVNSDPELAEGQFELAMLDYRGGRLNDAQQRLSELLDKRPDHTEAQNNLAWLLATHPRPERRDYPRAVTLARAAVLSNDQMKLSGYLDTLAVAEAGMGDLAAAATTLERAIKAAEAAGQSQSIPEMRERLKDFRAGRVYQAP